MSREKPSGTAVARKLSDTSSKHSSSDAKDADPASSQTALASSIATHLPDVAVTCDHSRPTPNMKEMQAAVLFLDISGFTALCEKYGQMGKTGAEQLTKTLNDYMSRLVVELLSYDGDILKFAGDAILTMWPVEGLHQMRAACEHAIRCALDIQRKHGSFITSVGVELKVKIGIAAGLIQMLYIGNDEARFYIEMGRGIEAVNKAENMCESGGDIVVSPYAWIHCQSLTGDYKVMADKKHIKVHSLTNDTVGSPYTNVRTMLVTPEMGSTNFVYMEDDDDDGDGGLKLSFANSSDGRRGSAITDDLLASGGQHLRRLRKALISPNAKYIDKLQLYVAVPVLRKLEEHAPLEYLSEMRQEKCSRYAMLWTMQKCLSAIFDNCKKMRGCISKIFLFDKGCTYIVVFGLPGFKHENDSAHALLAATHIYDDLSTMERLRMTSIGVTTGLTFCGVVGHNHRHEYTVIGRKVNLAARLMMYYPGKVICDKQTYYHSKINKVNFIPQKIKEMKGLRKVGAIFEFRLSTNVEDTVEALVTDDNKRPIIGRDSEMLKLRNVLETLKDAKLIPSSKGYKGKKRKGHSKEDDDEDLIPSMVVVSGDIGIGRSRLFDSFNAVALKLGYDVVSGTMAMHDQEIHFVAVRMLLSHLFHFELEHTAADRKKMLVAALGKNKAILKNLALLNSVFDIDEPLTEKQRQLSDDQRLLEMIKCVEMIITECAQAAKVGILFVIDDANYIDKSSWPLLTALGPYSVDDNGHPVVTLDGTVVRRSLVAINIKMPWEIPPIAFSAIGERNWTKRIVLAPVLPSFLAPLACQLLAVEMIPVKLDLTLRRYSMGVPSWVDLLLREYLYEGHIRMEPLRAGFNDDGMMWPDDKYHLDLIGRAGVASADEAISVTDARLLSSPFARQSLQVDTVAADTPMVCVCVQDVEAVGVPPSIKNNIQARLDRMDDIDQTVLKMASILGDKFSRAMLQELLQDTGVDNIHLGLAIERLADVGALACATKAESKTMSTVKRMKVKLTKPGGMRIKTCVCRDLEGLQEEKEMKHCRYLISGSVSVKVTAYEMMIELNRLPLHLKAVTYLEDMFRLSKTGLRTYDQFIVNNIYLFGRNYDSRLSEALTRLTITADTESGHVNKEERTRSIAQAAKVMRQTIVAKLSGVLEASKKGSTKSQVRSKLGESGAKSADGESVAETKRQFASRSAFHLERLAVCLSILIASADRHQYQKHALLADAVEGGALTNVVSNGYKIKVVIRQRWAIVCDWFKKKWQDLRRLLKLKPMKSSQTDGRNLIATKTVEEGKSGDTAEKNRQRVLTESEAQSLHTVVEYYSRIVEQYRMCGYIESAAFYLVEMASARLVLKQSKQAYDNLREVDRIYVELMNGRNPFEGAVANTDDWKPTSYDVGLLHCLMGQALWQLDERTEAALHFYSALENLGISKPKFYAVVLYRLCRERIKRWKRQYRDWRLRLHHSRHGMVARNSRIQQYRQSTLTENDVRCMAMQAVALSYVYMDIMSSLAPDLIKADLARIHIANNAVMVDDYFLLKSTSPPATPHLATETPLQKLQRAFPL